MFSFSLLLLVGSKYVVGSRGITQELDLVGIRHTGVGPDVMTSMAELVSGSFKPDSEVGAVIVGFDEHISYMKLFKAATYLDNPNVQFIATNTDERFPMPGGFVIPGTGSIVRAVEVCALRKPVIMGKPETSIAEPLFAEYGIVKERTLMVGDRGNTDILLGTRCGFQTLLVGSGVHNLTHVAEWKEGKGDYDDDVWKQCVPDVFVPKLGDLLSFMK